MMTREGKAVAVLMLAPLWSPGAKGASGKEGRGEVARTRRTMPTYTYLSPRTNFLHSSTTSFFSLPAQRFERDGAYFFGLLGMMNQDEDIAVLEAPDHLPRRHVTGMISGISNSASFTLASRRFPDSDTLQCPCPPTKFYAKSVANSWLHGLLIHTRFTELAPLVGQHT